MSSMASACDHVDHVRTQLPYALVVAAVAISVGDIPTAYGLHPAISLILGVTILWGILRFFGRPLEAAGASARDPIPGPDRRTA